MNGLDTRSVSIGIDSTVASTKSEKAKSDNDQSFMGQKRRENKRKLIPTRKTKSWGCRNLAYNNQHRYDYFEYMLFIGAFWGRGRGRVD
jgi:hypothetical protein